jgi:hypothetical protein
MYIPASLMIESPNTTMWPGVGGNGALVVLVVDVLVVVLGTVSTATARGRELVVVDACAVRLTEAWSLVAHPPATPSSVAMVTSTKLFLRIATIR